MLIVGFRIGKIKCKKHAKAKKSFFFTQINQNPCIFAGLDFLKSRKSTFNLTSDRVWIYYVLKYIIFSTWNWFGGSKEVFFDVYFCCRSIERLKWTNRLLIMIIKSRRPDPNIYTQRPFHEKYSKIPLSSSFSYPHGNPPLYLYLRSKNLNLDFLQILFYCKKAKEVFWIEMNSYL